MVSVAVLMVAVVSGGDEGKKKIRGKTHPLPAPLHTQPPTILPLLRQEYHFVLAQVDKTFTPSLTALALANTHKEKKIKPYPPTPLLHSLHSPPLP